MEKYQLVIAKKPADLVGQCNALAVEGYEPVGGIATNQYEFFQAMFLTNTKEKASATKSRGRPKKVEAKSEDETE